jgi:hypothetical protein
MFPFLSFSAAVPAIPAALPLCMFLQLSFSYLISQILDTGYWIQLDAVIIHFIVYFVNIFT